FKIGSLRRSDRDGGTRLASGDGVTSERYERAREARGETVRRDDPSSVTDATPRVPRVPAPDKHLRRMHEPFVKSSCALAGRGAPRKQGPHPDGSAHGDGRGARCRPVDQRSAVTRSPAASASRKAASTAGSESMRQSASLSWSNQTIASMRSYAR